MRLIGSAVVFALATGPVLAQTATPLPAPIPADRPVTRPAPGFERPVRPMRPRPDRPGDVDPGFSRPTRPDYGRPNYGRPGDPNYGRPGWQGNRGYAGQITCASEGDRERRCYARADNRVQLARQLSNTRCIEGRNFRATRDAILVRGGCRGEFLYGYGDFAGGGWGGGNYEPERRRSNAPAILGGVAVAGGLLAILAAENKGRERQAAERAGSPPPSDRPDDRTPRPRDEPAAPPPAYKPGPPAAISADLAALPADARPVAQTCLFEAAKQVGATGGTRISWDRLRELQPGNGGYRIRADLKADYPDGTRDLPIFCRATPQTVVQLDFG